MKKKLALITIVTAVVILTVVFLIALRYNVYPYLFCNPNHPNRVCQDTYVCVDSEGKEVGIVCVDARLDRFSRYYNGKIYEGGFVWSMSDIVLVDKETTKLDMMSQQIQGSYIADSGILAKQFSYVALQNCNGYHTIYVDLGECYWIQSFDNAKTAEEFFNTCKVTMTYTGEDASDVKEYVLCK